MNQRRETWRVFTLLAAGAMSVLAGAPLAPVVPHLQRAFADVPDVHWWAKLVLTLPGITIAVGAPAIGWLVDRAPKSRVLATSAIGFAVAGTSAYWCADSLIAILVGRAALGFAVAGLMTGATAIASELYHGPPLHRVLGLQAAWGGYAGVLFVVVGGLLADSDWRLPFLLHLVALAIVPGSLFALSAAHPNSDRVPEYEPPPRPHRDVLVLWCALAALEIILLYAVPLHYPFHLAALGWTEATDAGIGIASLLLVMAIASSSYHRLRVMLSTRVVYTLGFAIVGLGYVLLARVDDRTESYAALVVLGMGFGLLRPNLMAWVSVSVPASHRGRVFGLLTTSFFLGQFISPVLTQPVVSTSGHAALFRGLAASAMTLAFLFASSQLWLHRIRGASAVESRA